MKFLEKAVKYAPKVLSVGQKIAAGDYAGAVHEGIDAYRGRALVGGKMMSKATLLERRKMMGSGAHRNKCLKRIAYEEDDDQSYGC